MAAAAGDSFIDLCDDEDEDTAGHAQGAQGGALGASAGGGDGGDWEITITAVVEASEPAWLARARHALQILLADNTLAPKAVREAALGALSEIISTALARSEGAVGSSVYCDKLSRRIAKTAGASSAGSAGGVKLEAGEAPPKLSKRSSAQASPHGGAAAAGDDAAVSRAVQEMIRVLSSCGWWYDAQGEESADGTPRARVMLLAEARELPSLLDRLSHVAKVLLQLRVDAAEAEKERKAAATIMAALDALVIESDDDDESAAAWAERSASDAAKQLAMPSQAAAMQDDDVAGAGAGFDGGAGGGLDDGFDDEQWERYARSGAAADRPAPESPPHFTAPAPAPAAAKPASAVDAIVVSDDDDDVEIVAVVEAPRPAPRPERRAAQPPPPPPREECRITLFLPDGRGRARISLPPTSTLVDVYAQAYDYMETPARKDAVAAPPPVLRAHNWAMRGAVNTQNFRLIRPDPPPSRTFAPHELATTTLAAAGLYPSGRLVLELAGGGGIREAPRGAHFGGPVEILRLTTPLANGNTLVSPICLLHDPFGDKGLALFQKVESLMPCGWNHGQFVNPMHAAGFPQQVVLNNAYWQGAGGAMADRASIPAQNYAESSLRIASDAVRKYRGGSRAATAAADDLLRIRPLMQASGLLYTSGTGALPDHVDGIGHYLVLMSTLGCAVDFTAGDRVVRFQSGDVLIFNGGPAHGVMHGVRKVHPGTCPAVLPKLRLSRLSLQLRQH